MSKTKKKEPEPPPAKTMVVVLCDKCLRYSKPFEAYDKDLAVMTFVREVQTYYGGCSCGSAWTNGTILRRPESDTVKLVLAERDRDRYKQQLASADIKIEAYEKAMSLMGGLGGATRFHTMFGIPYRGF